MVHKNLEDNYGAVIVANHEALAQVLDQVSGVFLNRDLECVNIADETKS